MNRRIKNVFLNSTKTVDTIIIKNGVAPFIDENFFYTTGLEQGLFEGSCALLHADGSLDLFVSELEAESAHKAHATIHTYATKDEFVTLLTKLIKPSSTIGFNANGLCYQDYKKLQEMLPNTTFIDVSDGFTKTRLIKDQQEIDSIKHACAIADDTMDQLADLIIEGMTEDELAAEINYSLQSSGAEKPAFDTISSFGKNSAEPHYTHGDTKLLSGDLIVCDFGACYKKYNSDITRTFVFGHTAEKQKEMYRIVLEAQHKAFEALRPGVSAEEIHRVVQSFIDATPFKGRFIHSTGHCLGLAVHDGTGFATGNTMPLQENMILTVEPGIYLPGFGGVRIEDDIRITQDGFELLTKTPREFAVL